MTDSRFLQKLDPPFYVVSDTHWFHNNIVGFSGRDKQIRWLTGKDIDHNDYMVQRWNNVVGRDDTILHLGDLVWGGATSAVFFEEIAPMLNGDKYLILGNHDKKQWKQTYRDAGFKVIKPFTTKVNGKRVSFSHYPLDPSVHHENIIRVHGHIHNNGYPIAADWREGTVPTRENHINVSVEMIDYTPQKITDLIS